MKVLRVLVIAVVLIAAFSPVCRADSMRYVILGPEGLHLDCTFDTPGTYDVYASLTLDTPASGLEFTMPEFGATVLEMTFVYPVSGDLETGAFLDFGDCLSGTVAIFHMRFETDNIWGCPGLIRGTGEFLPRLVGCDDIRRDIVPPCSAASPDLLTPPDSAMAVPLSPLLSWAHGAGDYCNEGLGVYYYSIEYGTDPDDLNNQVGCFDTFEWTLKSLQPDTQYFWRLKLIDGAWEYAGSRVNYSDIHTFTTEGPVPIRRVTWGELKQYLQN